MRVETIWTCRWKIGLGSDSMSQASVRHLPCPPKKNILKSYLINLEYDLIEGFEDGALMKECKPK